MALECGRDQFELVICHNDSDILHQIINLVVKG